MKTEHPRSEAGFSSRNVRYITVRHLPISMSEHSEGKKGSNSNNSPYIIDETVQLEDFDGRAGYVWDIGEDIDPTSEYVIRAISRNAGTIEVLILPEEEAEAFQRGDNYWPEWKSPNETRISQEVTINTEDEDPYFHSEDLKLAVEASTHDVGERVTMKFREADE